jgi:hypothetical protein
MKGDNRAVDICGDMMNASGDMRGMDDSKSDVYIRENRQGNKRDDINKMIDNRTMFAGIYE